MNEELILPETDEVIAPTGNTAVPPAKPHSRKSFIFIFIIIAAVTFIALAVSLIIIITSKSPTPPPTDSPDQPSQTQESFYYDVEEFANAMGSADFYLKDENYDAVEYYLSLYPSPERMTSAQKYRFYSINAELYDESHLNNAELAQKYSNLANRALQSIREGGN